MKNWDNTSFNISKAVYYALFGAAALFVTSYFADALFNIALALILFTIISVMLDAFLLYRIKNGISAKRMVGERMSMGDDNKLTIEINNHYHYKIHCLVIDELGWMPIFFNDHCA